MMDTREVAAYLRLKQRRIYDLVRRRAIPHVRATGKLLFPRAQVDAWIAGKGEAPVAPARSRPPIIAGSHDPLLEWSVRESRCGLAILAGGSRAGIDTLARGEAVAAAIHWLDEATGAYNVPLIRQTLAGADVVALEWARRTQGLLLREGNPHRIRTMSDLARKRLRIATRQPESGSHRLFHHLLEKAGVRPGQLDWLPRAAHAETELAAIIRDGYKSHGARTEFISVCFGEDGAFPHHTSGSRALRPNDAVLLDIGGRSEGYPSDMTRVGTFGKAPEEFDAVWSIVDRAVEAALAAAKPGNPAKAVDQAAREVITAAGYGDRFPHRTGHGLGIDVHEEPYMTGTSERPIEVGNVFSIEPGIYLPGHFGIRLEEIVIVREHGAEILSELPRTAVRRK
jgi:excisionase family DNA binding protein